MNNDMALLLNAIAFASRAHRHHLRKDRDTPYVSHVFRVCMVVRQVFGVDDPSVLTAALLHDTIEDTTTDFDDLAEQFGPEISSWVSALTKDKRLPDEERERAYEDTLRRSCWQVKVCKLADIFDNLIDSSNLGADQRRRTISRSQRYLAAVSTDAPNDILPAIRAVRELLGRSSGF